jgi:hypothetical protein
MVRVRLQEPGHLEALETLGDRRGREVSLPELIQAAVVVESDLQVERAQVVHGRHLRQ